MSRNQSINKLAPHISTSLPGTEEKQTSHIPPFSPYYKQATDKQASANQQHTSNDEKLENRPEIFTLVENPKLQDLFVLSNGDADAKLMLILKTIRTKRGINAMIPFSDSEQVSKCAPAYKQTSRYFESVQSTSFVGKM
jgi:hypothetical protein